MTDWIEAQVTTKASPRSVAATVSRLTGILSARSMKVFAVIDQSEQAREAGLRLRETTLVIFGSPAAGTPVSTEYYTRLGQGSDHHPSGQVLDAIARALRLGADATAHLHEPRNCRSQPGKYAHGG